MYFFHKKNSLQKPQGPTRRGAGGDHRNTITNFEFKRASVSTEDKNSPTLPREIFKIDFHVCIFNSARISPHGSIKQLVHGTGGCLNPNGIDYVSLKHLPCVGTSQFNLPSAKSSNQPLLPVLDLGVVAGSEHALNKIGKTGIHFSYVILYKKYKNRGKWRFSEILWYTGI